MDESDADQILAIDELRSLRDRMGHEAPGFGAVSSAAPVEVPNRATAAAPESGADPWDDLRRRASEQRRWGRLVLIGGSLAVTAGAIAVVLIAHGGSAAPAPAKAPAPAVPAPPVSPSAPTAVSSAAQPAPEPSAVLPVPTTGAAPSPSAQDPTAPPAAAVLAPTTTHRPKPPSGAPGPITRHAPSVAPADGPAPGAAADRSGAPSEAGSTDPTLSRTPTSWSPVSPP